MARPRRWRRPGAAVVAVLTAALVGACGAAPASMPAGRLTSAAAANLDVPKTPVAWVTSPLGHSVCTPYGSGSVCISVIGMHERAEPEPRNAPASLVPQRPSETIRLRLTNTSGRAVALPVFGPGTYLQLMAFEPNLVALSTYDQGASGSGDQLHWIAGRGCVRAVNPVVVLGHGSAVACGAFNLFTSSPLQTGPSATTTYFANRFSYLEVAGVALFASRYFGGWDSGEAINGPFAPPDWNLGHSTQNLALYSLSGTSVGAGLVTDLHGRGLGYEGRGGVLSSGGPSRSWICGGQADDADAGNYQCQVGLSGTWSFTDPRPSEDGYLVLHIWFGRQPRGVVVRPAPSWIDVQYGCNATGCNSARLYPALLRTSELPVGCGSTRALRLPPGVPSTSVPKVLAGLPRALASFDRRTLCEVFAVPPGATMYEGGVAVKFAARHARLPATIDTFYELPMGNY